MDFFDGTLPGIMPYDLRSDFLLGPLPSEGDGKRLGPVILRRKIGQGGMGVVYEGHHEELGRDVAVKCLFTSWAEQDPTYVRRFQREAKIAETLDHENLVRVFGRGCVHGIHYLVMELLTGLTLGKTVRRGGPLAPAHAARIAHDAGDALALAHANQIIHRDVKPDNIFITDDGAAKLMDLGLAKATRAHDSFATASGVILGSLPFMSPEQHRGLSEVGPAGDVYSLGATLWYALTGEHPPRQQPMPDVRTARADVPPELAAIILRATSTEPSARYGHSGDLTEALDDFLSVGDRSSLGRDIGDRISAQAEQARAMVADETDDFLEDFPSASPSPAARTAAEPPPLPREAMADRRPTVPRRQSAVEKLKNWLRRRRSNTR